MEADQLEINLTRFPTRFPEKRPFFIEGNSAFATPLELFYSRRIGSKGDILWGTNVTGKVGNNTLGFISSQTGAWGAFGLHDVTREEESALFTVLRAKRDILERFSVGALYAAKEMTEGSSRVGGLDASIGLRENSILTGQFAQSWNFEKSGMNRAYTFNFARGTENFNARFAAERIEPEFSVNQTGFLRKEASRGWQHVRIQFEYTPRPEKFGLQKLFIGSKGRLSQSLYADQYFINWKHRNSSLQIHPEFEENLLLWSNSVWLQMKFQKTLLERAEIAFHFAKEAELTAVFLAKEMEAFLRTDTARKLSFSLQVAFGDFYNFFKKYVGKQNRLDLRATLRPQSNIAFGLTSGFARSKNPQRETDGDFLTQSLRVTYLFTRGIFLRLFTQVGWNQTYYEKTKTSHRFLISGLLGWEYSPKSHLFLAYNENWDTPGERLRLENRVFVLKLSYLWNL